ncbi:hypothetical protein M422DRAFT_266397 [Sphaerobolus stellatus SS14]|uniref:Uncharacterized protein n=1 Tax=Sphaerobolus stellatus (strain SS14) TaxID=990650 RepID=A0A0C9UBC7_SPHS4|nr:hypothetical protein M422DRAFT_266397 [Sphaerobolus stellatus SS14]
MTGHNIGETGFQDVNIHPTQVVPLGSVLGTEQHGANQYSSAAPTAPPPGYHSSSDSDTINNETRAPNSSGTQDPVQSGTVATSAEAQIASLQLHLLELRKELLMAKSHSSVNGEESATAVTKEQTKLAIPDIIPGFKSNPMEIPISRKVAEAVKTLQYVPYSWLTPAARE